MPDLPRKFVHDANQCLHVIRLAAESLLLDSDNPNASPERRLKRLNAILEQVDCLSGMMDAPFPATADRPGADEDLGESSVLVVDDEALAALMLAEHLEQRGWKVQVAHDGQEALDKCSDEIFEAVITDIRMPRMNGDELIRRLDQLQPGTPVLVVSGHVDSSDKGRYPANVRRIFAKPFAPALISDELASLRANAPKTGE